MLVLQPFRVSLHLDLIRRRAQDGRDGLRKPYIAERLPRDELGHPHASTRAATPGWSRPQDTNTIGTPSYNALNTTPCPA
jgi:hypothetical protein